MNHFVCLGWLRSHEFPRNATEVREVVELLDFGDVAVALNTFSPPESQDRRVFGRGWVQLHQLPVLVLIPSVGRLETAFQVLRVREKKNQSSSETLLQWSHHFDRDPSALPQQVIQQATGSAQNWDEGERPAQGHAPLRRQSH